MEVSKLYKLNRGNQNQAVGLIVMGAGASVQVLGSSTKPESLADMVDCTDAVLLDEGSWTFSMLPEFVYFVGTADGIFLVGMNSEDLKITL